MFTTIIDSLIRLRDAESLETIRSLEVSDGNFTIDSNLLQDKFIDHRLVFRQTILRSWG